MATATNVNKSEEIRKLHASGVKTASEIVTKLKHRGVKVVPAQVYQALSKSRKAKSTKAPASPDVRIPMIDEALVFVRAAGGITNAKALLSKLSQFQN